MIPWPLFALACLLLVASWAVLAFVWGAYRDLVKKFDRQAAELAELKGRKLSYENGSGPHTTEVTSWRQDEEK